jgi:hypothetical protein
MAAENLYCIRAISLDELASDVLNKILIVHLTAKHHHTWHHSKRKAPPSPARLQSEPDQQLDRAAVFFPT